MVQGNELELAAVLLLLLDAPGSMTGVGLCRSLVIQTLVRACMQRGVWMHGVQWAKKGTTNMLELLCIRSYSDDADVPKYREMAGLGSELEYSAKADQARSAGNIRESVLPKKKSKEEEEEEEEKGKQNMMSK